jgi:hypothetical protein
VTDETKVVIPSNLDEWKNCVIYFSPKIETGVDFSFHDIKTKTYYHLGGKSINPSSMYQMICRNRLPTSLTWFSVPMNDKKPQYESLDHAKEVINTDSEVTSNYMCSAYMDSNDNITYSDNSFNKIYVFNEYIKDLYCINKADYLKDILIKAGFNMSEDLGEKPVILDKVTKKEMKDMTEVEIDKEFVEWTKGKINETYDIRSSMLKLHTTEQQIEYAEYIKDKKMFENHLNLLLLIRDSEFINDSAAEYVKNSFFEFGIQNIYSKIKLINKFETETGIDRFDNKLNKLGSVNKSTWTMIKKLFRKKAEMPKTDNAIRSEYAKLINHIQPNVYKTERKQKNNVSSSDYTVNKELIDVSLKLDKIRNPYEIGYERKTMECLGHKKVEDFIEDDEYKENDKSNTYDKSNTIVDDEVKNWEGPTELDIDFVDSEIYQKWKIYTYGKQKKYTPPKKKNSKNKYDFYVPVQIKDKLCS